MLLGEHTPSEAGFEGEDEYYSGYGGLSVVDFDADGFGD